LRETISDAQETNSDAQEDKLTPYTKEKLIVFEFDFD
jgi:hypothetical protein